MRSVFQSVRLRRILWAIVVAALVVFAIVWIRHALALRNWRREHGVFRESIVRQLLGRRRTIHFDPSCSSRLRLWLFCLYSYQESEGALPQVWTPGGDGTLMHSWRSALLAHLEIPYASEYRYEEPWNGAHNQQFLDRPLQWVYCPKCEQNLGTAITNYVAVVGPQCMWRADRGVSFDEVTDDPAQTILLVEWPQSDIHFLEPRDLSVDQFVEMWSDPTMAWVHESEPPFLQTHGTLFMHVGMVDGSIRRLPRGTPPETLRALLTIDGGEIVGDPFLR